MALCAGPLGGGAGRSTAGGPGGVGLASVCEPRVCASACARACARACAVRVPCACRARELEGALAARPAEPHCPPLQDSYLLDYFFSLNRYFEVGAPVYFVTTGGFNFSSAEGMNSICSSAGCDSSSLSQKIQYATEFPEQ